MHCPNLLFSSLVWLGYCDMAALSVISGVMTKEEAEKEYLDRSSLLVRNPSDSMHHFLRVKSRWDNSKFGYSEIGDEYCRAQCYDACAVAKGIYTQEEIGLPFELRSQDLDRSLRRFIECNNDSDTVIYCRHRCTTINHTTTIDEKDVL